jgi:hypothetical protein
MGCGGSSPGKIEGKLDGAAITVRDALSDTLTDGSSAHITLTETADVCGAFAAGKQPANMKALALELRHLDAQGHWAAPLTTGSYPLIVSDDMEKPNSNVALAYYGTTDGKCQLSKVLQAKSGSVTIDHIEKGTYAGTFDVTFDNGERVTGRFDAPQCPDEGKSVSCSEAK